MHVGPTPARALGATDQHSQVQLYVEGPFDKAVLFVEVERFAADAKIPKPAGALKALAKHEAFAYLGGRTLAELLAAELAGTRVALTDAGRANMTLRLSRLTPETLGGLFYLLELATAYAGRFYHVNAFDQPGVEAGKRAAFALMGRKGYEDERARIERRRGAVERREV